MLVKRVKNQGGRAVIKENYKKEVVVSGYKVTFLDMIYVSNDKYEMLITSSTDGIIRGWDIHGTVPTLAKQPENEYVENGSSVFSLDFLHGVG